MKNILTKINQLPGVIGSSLVAEDGIVIASELGINISDEIVGAMVSTVGSTTMKSIERLKQGEMNLVIIEAQNGKLFVTPTNKGFLGVLTEDDGGGAFGLPVVVAAIGAPTVFEAEAVAHITGAIPAIEPRFHRIEIPAHRDAVVANFRQAEPVQPQLRIELLKIGNILPCAVILCGPQHALALPRQLLRYIHHAV